MEQVGLSPRVSALLAGFRAARPEVFAERAVLVTRVYAQNGFRVKTGG